MHTPVVARLRRGRRRGAASRTDGRPPRPHVDSLRKEAQVLRDRVGALHKRLQSQDMSCARARPDTTHAQWVMKASLTGRSSLPGPLTEPRSMTALTAIGGPAAASHRRRRRYDDCPAVCPTATSACSASQRQFAAGRAHSRARPGSAHRSPGTAHQGWRATKRATAHHRAPLTPGGGWQPTPKIELCDTLQSTPPPSHRLVHAGRVWWGLGHRARCWRCRCRRRPEVA